MTSNLASSALPMCAAVIVTYGRRLELVEQVVCRLLQLPLVGHIVIVDNASERPLDISGPRITILRQSENAGSAGGYRVGIAHASRLAGIDHIILLDDDLMPLPGALERAVTMLSGAQSTRVLVIPREDRPTQREILSQGVAPAILTDSFHDFHVAKWLLARKNRERADDDMIFVDHAPYGGMIIPCPIARRAELPDASLFVYCDDYDYVMKLRNVGVQVFLCDIPPLQSIDPSWNQRRTIAPAAFAPLAPAFRVYYATRNRVAFERRYVIRRRWVYILNALAFVALGILVSTAENRRPVSARRIRLLLTAIYHGWKGDMKCGPATIERYS